MVFEPLCAHECMNGCWLLDMSKSANFRPNCRFSVCANYQEETHDVKAELAVVWRLMQLCLGPRPIKSLFR